MRAFGKHEGDARAMRVEALGQAIAGRTEPARDERRKLPAQHKDVHNFKLQERFRQGRLRGDGVARVDRAVQAVNIGGGMVVICDLMPIGQ